MRSITGGRLGVLVIGLGALAFSSPLAARNKEVIVYSYLTAEGRKTEPATTANPKYCVLISGGFQQEGGSINGVDSPPTEEVEGLVRQALAGQGYLRYQHGGPLPDVVLVYHWGLMMPAMVPLEAGGVDGFAQRSLNEPLMLQLVGAGSAAADVGAFPQFAGIRQRMERQKLMEAVHDDRFFVVVTAYDYPASTRREKVRLWGAMMSLDIDGTNLDEALPLLAEAGAPHFGRQMTGPARIVRSPGGQGSVTAGPLQVIEYLPAGKNPESK